MVFVLILPIISFNKFITLFWLVFRSIRIRGAPLYDSENLHTLKFVYENSNKKSE